MRLYDWDGGPGLRDVPPGTRGLGRYGVDDRPRLSGDELRQIRRRAQAGLLESLSRGQLPSIGLRAEVSPWAAAGPILIGLGLLGLAAALIGRLAKR